MQDVTVVCSRRKNSHSTARSVLLCGERVRYYYRLWLLSVQVIVTFTSLFVPIPAVR